MFWGRDCVTRRLRRRQETPTLPLPLGASPRIACTGGRGGGCGTPQVVQRTLDGAVSALSSLLVLYVPFIPSFLARCGLVEGAPKRRCPPPTERKGGVKVVVPVMGPSCAVVGSAAAAAGGGVQVVRVACGRLSLGKKKSTAHATPLAVSRFGGGWSRSVGQFRCRSPGRRSRRVCVCARGSRRWRPVCVCPVRRLPSASVRFSRSLFLALFLSVCFRLEFANRRRNMTTPRGAQRVRYARFLFRILAPCEEGGNVQLSLRRTVSL